MPYDIIIGRDKADKIRFGTRGLIYIGKGWVTMGNYTSLSNLIWLDVARSHVIMIAGKRGCLTGETLIFTDKGHKKIKDFNIKEDQVLSFNKDKKDFEWENAELLEYPIKDEDLYEIEFNDGKKIRLTREHPLLKTIVSKRGLLSLMWEKAENFKINDLVLSLKDKLNPDRENLIPLKIKSITKIKNIDKVYDLSVDKNHSFIANGIISHNSGKSYTLGVIAEELCDLPKEVSQNIAPLIFDTMGIFWTMKFKNEKESELLQEWDLKPKTLPMVIWAPHGFYKEYEKRRIPVDKKFALEASELNAEDWILTFNLDMIDPIAVLTQDVIGELKKQKTYTVDDIIKRVGEQKVDEKTKAATMALFRAAKTWGVFAEKGQEGTKISELISAGKSTILDVSCYSSIGTFNVRALVIGLVCKKIFNERMLARKKEEMFAIEHGIDYLNIMEKREVPLVWLFLDEGHEFLPKEGKTAATDALIQVLREGRQPGLSLVIATQQPGAIHRDAMTQSDVVISHRVTAKPDMEALNSIMQTYLLESIRKAMDALPPLKGSAIILDDNSERIYPMRVRPRFTWHGGEAPTAIRVRKRI